MPHHVRFAVFCLTPSNGEAKHDMRRRFRHTHFVERSFSWWWVVIGVAAFTAAEIAIGMLVGPLVIGRFVTPMLRMRVEMALHLASYFVGGYALGVMTPGSRLPEAAIAAVASVSLSFLMSFFLPHTFISFSLDKVMVSGAIACTLAVVGAYSGDRLMGSGRKS